MKRLVIRWLASASLLFLAGCGETLFRSNFDQTAANQPPAAAQGIGTAAIHGDANSVLVVDPPVTPSGKWLKVERFNPGAQVAGFQGRLTAERGDGKYTLTTTMFMPAGAGTATIQFERFGQPVEQTLNGFLHLDFMPENNVRIDDSEGTRFGRFIRDQPFIVQVQLTVGPTSTARITLDGAGVDKSVPNEANRTVPPPFNDNARRFGTVRLWMGSPHVGRFNATNIVVKRN